ncbi:hypothetical protein ACFWGY_03695 [Prauserella salsuginis]|uniref:Uncharacterized protein n=1 Tax=Prauserella salsuginis TaxID=387889 RepID=A0ABW6FXP6_9PSEU
MSSSGQAIRPRRRDLACGADLWRTPPLHGRSAYVQLRVRTVDVDSGREHYREVAAETAQAALTKLG